MPATKQNINKQSIDEEKKKREKKTRKKNKNFNQENEEKIRNDFSIDPNPSLANLTYHIFA